MNKVYNFDIKDSYIKIIEGESSIFLVPEGIKRISAYAFWGWPNLKTVVIPDSVVEIDGSCFNDWNKPNLWDYFANLEKIKIPFVGRAETYGPLNSTSLGASSKHFGAIFSARQIYSYSGDYHYYIGDSTAYEFKIPSTLKEVIITRANGIYENSFRNCKYIEKITLPETVEFIEQEAFQYCSNLKELNIPKSVKNIGDYAFNGCTNLISLNYNGSTSEWLEIKKYGWKEGSKLSKIICIDGTITL